MKHDIIQELNLILYSYKNNLSNINNILENNEAGKQEQFLKGQRVILKNAIKNIESIYIKEDNKWKMLRRL